MNGVSDLKRMLYVDTKTWLPDRLLTKADKLKKGPANNTLLQVRKALAALPDVTVQLFSSLKQTGVQEARQHICRWLGLHGNP